MTSRPGLRPAQRLNGSLAAAPKQRYSLTLDSVVSFSVLFAGRRKAGFQEAVIRAALVSFAFSWVGRRRRHPRQTRRGPLVGEHLADERQHPWSPLTHALSSAASPAPATRESSSTKSIAMACRAARPIPPPNSKGSGRVTRAEGQFTYQRHLNDHCQGQGRA